MKSTYRFTGSLDFSQVNAATIVGEILQQIICDPVLKIVPNSPGWKMQQLATVLLDKNWTEPPLQKCAQGSLKLIMDSLCHLKSGRSVASGEYAVMQSLFAGRREISCSWVQGLSLLGLDHSPDTYSILGQNVLDRMLPIIRHVVVPPQPEEKKPRHILPLTWKKNRSCIMQLGTYQGNYSDGMSVPPKTRLHSYLRKL